MGSVNMGYFQKYVDFLFEDLMDVFEERERIKYLILLQNDFSMDNAPYCLLKMIELAQMLIRMIRHLKQSTGLIHMMQNTSETKNENEAEETMDDGPSLLQ